MVLNIIVPAFDLGRSYGKVRYGKSPENVWKSLERAWKNLKSSEIYIRNCVRTLLITIKPKCALATALFRHCCPSQSTLLHFRESALLLQSSDMSRN